jgi:glucosamine-6-phosphate deaminase
MEINCRKTRRECGALAATAGREALKRILDAKAEANIILATGLSQFDMLAELVAYGDIAWERVNAFHLDEYIGLPIRHPASFRGILWREFAAKLPVPLKSFAWIDGEADLEKETKRLGALIRAHPVDIAFIGIGENGHLAFNDPPADFVTEEPFLVVTLDEACRRQQMGEGWFKTIGDVPERALSMSVRQILKSKELIVTCPDGRKAEAVRNTVEKGIDPLFPSTTLRTHPCAKLYLDADSASLLARNVEYDAALHIPVEPLS